MSTAEEQANEILRNAVNAMDNIKVYLEHRNLTVKQGIKRLMEESQNAADAYEAADPDMWQKFDEKREELAEFIESRCVCSKGGVLLG
jgi:hypothetical protein